MYLSDMVQCGILEFKHDKRVSESHNPVHQSSYSKREVAGLLNFCSMPQLNPFKKYQYINIRKCTFTHCLDRFPVDVQQVVRHSGTKNAQANSYK